LRGECTKRTLIQHCCQLPRAKYLQKVQPLN
jgi:hypothetical protein